MFYGSIEATFEGIDQWKKRVKQEVISKGFVSTLLQRRRFIKDVESNHAGHEGLRRAHNAAVQGSAADIIKRASIQMSEALQKQEETQPQMRQVRLMAQIHDELLYEVPVDLVQSFVPLLVHVMESCVKHEMPTVQLIAKPTVGRRWGSMGEYDAGAA